MLKKNLIRLSQSHLNLFSTCPPKFQQVYLDGLGLLPDSEQQDSMDWGSRFHLLMQQRELTLPIEALLATDSELERSLKALIESSPDLVSDYSIWREAEHSRTLTHGNFLLTVIYDLLIATADRATIFDWKTYRKPQSKQKLADNWQTRLYLYVLAETANYTPEQIQMIYWFVKSGKPKSVIFNYSQQQHQQTAQDLANLLTNLDTWWNNYQQFQANFPHRLDCQSDCPYYQFLAAEITAKNYTQELTKSLDEIEEIPI